jgi:chromosome segregation ATPase
VHAVHARLLTRGLCRRSRHLEQILTSTRQELKTSNAAHEAAQEHTEKLQKQLEELRRERNVLRKRLSSDEDHVVAAVQQATAKANERVEELEARNARLLASLQAAAIRPKRRSRRSSTPKPGKARSPDSEKRAASARRRAPPEPLTPAAKGGSAHEEEFLLRQGAAHRERDSRREDTMLMHLTASEDIKRRVDRVSGRSISELARSPKQDFAYAHTSFHIR